MSNPNKPYKPYFLRERSGPGVAKFRKPLQEGLIEIGQGLAYTVGETKDGKPTITLMLTEYSQNKGPSLCSMIPRHQDGSPDWQAICFLFPFIMLVIQEIVSSPDKWSRSITCQDVPLAEGVDIDKVKDTPFFKQTFDSIIAQDVLRSVFAKGIDLANIDVSLKIGNKEYKIGFTVTFAQGDEVVVKATVYKPGVKLDREQRGWIDFQQISLAVDSAFTIDPDESELTGPEKSPKGSAADVVFAATYTFSKQALIKDADYSGAVYQP